MLCMQPVPRTSTSQFPGNRLLRRRSSVGYKVGQELILATPDEKFTQVRLWNILLRDAGTCICCQTPYEW